MTILNGRSPKGQEPSAVMKLFLKEIRYEGYGPGGVAILIEALTDNRNRAAADLRSAFSKNGGNLGETGCVSWMFSQKGVVSIAEMIEEDALLELSIEGGADNYEWMPDDEEITAEIFTEPANLENLSQILQSKAIKLADAELRWIPENTIEITDLIQAKSLIKLVDALESLDDVRTVTANFDLADEISLETLA